MFVNFFLSFIIHPSEKQKQVKFLLLLAFYPFSSNPISSWKLVRNFLFFFLLIINSIPAFLKIFEG